ncbi:hypothetical protein LINPERPRIM_LOCUS23708 [Linum perenne]
MKHHILKTPKRWIYTLMNINNGWQAPNPPWTNSSQCYKRADARNVELKRLEQLMGEDAQERFKEKSEATHHHLNYQEMLHQQQQQTARFDSLFDNISSMLQGHQEIHQQEHQSGARDNQEMLLRAHEHQQCLSRTQSALDNISSMLQAHLATDIKLEQPKQLMKEDAQELFEEEDDPIHNYYELEESDEEPLAVVANEGVELIHLGSVEFIHPEVKAEEEHIKIEESSSCELPPSQPVDQARDEHVESNEVMDLEVYILDPERPLDDHQVEKMELIDHATPYYLFPPVGEFEKNLSSNQNHVLLEHYRLHHPSGVQHGTQPLALKKTINFKELLSWGP